MEELISVIIPIYNCENYLYDSVKSILNQSYRNLEVILINDGSTDNSLLICEELALEDKRVQVITQENSGVSGARNKGLDIAKGKYIYFMDADDYVEKDIFKDCISVYKKYDTEFVISGLFSEVITKNKKGILKIRE